MQTQDSSSGRLAYSIREACEATSLGRTNLYRHINSGDLRVVRIGGRVLIPATELASFISGGE